MRACRGGDDVAAYLDCELDALDSRQFEEHVRGCGPCAASLNEQKRLLRLLDTTLSHPSIEQDISLPKYFARVVTAHARTDMSGVRGAAERRRALLLCGALAAGALVLLGAAALEEGLTPLARFARTALGLLGMAGHAALDALSSAAASLRTALPESPAFKLLT
ncbi:MAG TPA: zf-HC2 domain-containing protein, partial [Pyrinomonadaceae bacterium]|nr:zf-HC2 domain-containing protein [Pyrinomonadaceae bacterium]